ncbi:MAG: hypothetical protein M4D80_26285 [Myxococcota bacterium]|nr:hypothetical protein [Myxococcota bacterium]
MTEGKRTYGKTLAAAKEIADPEARALFLETELDHVDKPAKLVEPLAVALAAAHAGDAFAAKLAAIARAHPTRPALLDLLGAKLVAHQHLDDALEVLRLAAAAGSKNVRTHEVLGRILLIRGEALGVRALERVLELDPDRVQPRVYIASWFVERTPARALAILDGVDLSYAYELRAMAHEALGRPDDAAAALGEALAEFENDLAARWKLASWHCSERRYVRGLVHGRVLFELRTETPQNELLTFDLDEIDKTIVQAYRHGGVLQEIVPWVCERFATGEIAPGVGAQLFTGLPTIRPCPAPEIAIRAGEAMARAARERGDEHEARIWRVRIAGLRADLGDIAALEALAHDGLDDDPLAWVQLADSYRSVHAYDAASAAVDRALELDEHCAAAFITLFGLALEAGDLDALDRASRAIAEAKPLWHQGPEHLGRTLARRCDPAAVAHAERGAAIAPWCHNAWLAVGEAQLVAGDLDAARAALVRVQEIDPAEPGDDTSILQAALEGKPDELERALAERYKHLASLPFPAFVEKLRATAKP